MPKRTTRRQPHRVTAKGMTGLGGGRWGSVPQPPFWYAASVQLCGIYPFAAGTTRPAVGTPLGRDMAVGSAVAGDMKTWYDAGLVSSPSMMLFGLNGNGKSSVAQRLMYGMAARGIAPAVFDPLKGEHVAAVNALGGTTVSIGPKSRDRINPLDLGALGDAAAQLGGKVGEDLRAQAVRAAVDLVALIVQVNRGRPLTDVQDTVLSLMVRSVIDRVEAPWMGDLLAAFDAPPPEATAGQGESEDPEFRRQYSDLRASVWSVLNGDLAQLVGGRASVRLEVGNPGGFCFDTSAIPASNRRLLSAAMLATWSIGFGAIDAHWELAQHERAQAEAAAAAGEAYEPKVRWGGYLAMQDEFWFPMRACEGIVDRADRIGRTNRGLGVSELKITHSPKDAFSLPNPQDRETARGFAQRSGVLGLMALSMDDLGWLDANVVPLNGQEKAIVNGFNAPPNWKPRLDSDGNPLPPPGAGKILLKVPGRVGIPVQMTLTEAEKRLHVTDERSRRHPRATGVGERNTAGERSAVG